jgi:hypothetical protein
VLKLRRPVDRLEGHWLKALAAVDACGRHPGPVVHGTCILDDPDHPGGDAGLAARLRTAAALLAPDPRRGADPAVGGRPHHPGRHGRSAHRPCRPRRRLCLPRLPAALAWCEAHHLWHWLDGGPTDPANLVLCRAHHRAVHAGGLAAGPTTRRAAGTDNTATDDTTPPPEPDRDGGQSTDATEPGDDMGLQEHWALPGTLSPACCAEPAGWTVVE